VWTWHGRSLLEFPPAIAYGRLYLTTFDGRFVELDRRTGRALWIYTSHRCGWASPAVAGRLVYVTFIGRAARCNARVPGTDGELVAFAADSHRVRIRWRLHLGPTESSPLVAGGLVYVGDWRGKVYAVDRLTGKVRWTFATGGKIKGSAALAGGRVFIGSYDGHVYALDARTGRLRWRASAQPRFGSTGTFYATPAVAFGRVYVGSTDGKVYSFGATSGRLLWSQGTGGYVYSSAAVSGRLVLVGSYDHRFYALDAATGDVRWRFRADGPISGSATVLGNLVYFSTFATTTYALDVRTGRVVWTFRDGKYSPVVADADRVYLVGFGRLYALERPVRSAHAVRRHGGSRVRRVAPRRGAARGGAQRRRP
jgi:outer membrane protein assembly factor BamB